MSESNARFFGIEHQTAMVIATAVAHIGMGRAKRAADVPDVVVNWRGERVARPSGSAL